MPPPTGSAACCVPRASQPGDHVALCMENHDRYLEVVWGCHYAGARVHGACSSRLTSGELVVHPQRLRGQGVHHLEVQGRPGRRDRRRHARRRTAPHARRHDRRLRELRDRRRRPGSRRRSTSSASPASTCSTRRAPPASPRASPRPFPNEPLEGTPAVSRARSAAAVRRRRHDSVYLSPAPFYHAAPLRFCMRCAWRRRDRRRDGALRRRAVPAARRASTTSPTARSCRRCSCACSSSTAEVRGEVRRLVARSA